MDVMNKFMIRFYSATLILLAILVVVISPVSAQETGALSLRMTRVFGYSSGMGKIQGTFTLKASGSEDLQRVTFYIDDQSMGEVTAGPFHLRFDTDEYPLGMHQLHAVGETKDGAQLVSNQIQAQFVSSQEGIQAAVKIVIPLLIAIVAALALSMAFTMLSGRKVQDLPLGAERNYGMVGGAICPRCNRPFSRHVLSPNMLVGKLERCPYCGKWSIVAAAPLEDLRAAERAEITAAQEGGEVTQDDAEERLRKDLEDSRYQDL
jgi:hypothetical protein